MVRLCQDGYDVVRLCQDGYDVVRLCQDGYDVVRLCQDGYDVVKTKCPMDSLSGFDLKLAIFPAVTCYKHVVPVKLGSLWWACISEIGTLLNQPQNTQHHSGENSLIHQRADKCDCHLITRAGENDTAMI